ncbi:hypothetical protein CULT_2290004 [[Clostridium] ultunense Esp]|nr:hypothetical protein CULT_2290004 [[Clostridium] ultunense Esp]
MNKIKDPQLFKSIKTFLTVYLPIIRAKSPNTINSYRDTLNLFISFLKDTKDLSLNEITTEYFNRDDISNLSVIGKGTKFRTIPLSKEVTAMFKQYVSIFHANKIQEDFLFYTTRKGITGKMSPDNVARFLNTYEKDAKVVNPALPHLHPHLFRHARAMHLYKAGMPLPLVSEWLGHSQLETSLIYAYADTEIKRAAADKVINAENSVFTNEKFIYQDDEETIKKLYGLA